MSPDPRQIILVQSLRELGQFLGKKLDTQEKIDLSETNRLLQELVIKADEGYEITLELE